MYCHRCGNKLYVDSLFCNRCGTKVRTVEERLNRPRIPVPQQRPARRRLSAENQPSPYDPRFYQGRYAPYEEYYDEEEEDYEEDENAEYNEQGELILFRINQAFYPVGMAYSISAALTIVMTALTAYFRVSFWLPLVSGLIFFIPAVIRHFKHMRTLYTLTDTKLEIRSGLFAKSSRNIPLRHIQDVFVSETIKERLIGIGDIIIDTAASDSKISIDNINDPRKYADMILDQMHDLD